MNNMETEQLQITLNDDYVATYSSERIDFLFVNPCDDFLTNKGDRPPLGLGYLCSFVKSKKYTAKIIDLNHDSSDKLYTTAKKYKPYAICFSVSTPTYSQSIKLANELRKFCDDSILIAGGNHITDMPDDGIAVKTFDALIKGDGELALLKIVEEGARGFINGIPVQNIDELPMPDYDELKLERYNMMLNGISGIIMNSSRGCCFNCGYCGSAKLKKWRPHSPERVLQEMILLYEKYGKRAFYFGDDIFTFDKNRVKKICNLIINTFGERNITWRATTRSDLLDKELCKIMHDAGCDILSLGLESGNDMVLRAMNKGMTVAQQREAVGWCHDVGIKVKGFFILGLPKETKETLRDTINFAKSLNLEYCDVYPLTPFPSTPIWDNPEKFGLNIIKPKNNDVDSWNDYFQVGKEEFSTWKVIHPNLTENDIKEAIKMFKEEVTDRGSTYSK